MLRYNYTQCQLVNILTTVQTKQQRQTSQEEHIRNPSRIFIHTGHWEEVILSKCQNERNPAEEQKSELDKKHWEKSTRFRQSQMSNHSYGFPKS